MIAEHRRQFAVEVVKRLREAGFEALWAGGCVRDLLLERAPIDYDVATSARPEQVRALFGQRRTLSVGAAFGVIIVQGPTPKDGQIEVATFRNDAQYSDGRRPDSVTFSTAIEDAARRDFTINGMFYDPLAEQVIDYVGGREDLNRGLIRAIGNADERIGEDKLRMLRAVRFAARFNFAIESATEAALARHAHDLSLVSGERMTAELHKTLITPGREMALRTWAETRLLEVLLPKLARHWLQVGQRCLTLLRHIEPEPWTAALAACLLPLANAAHQQPIDGPATPAPVPTSRAAMPAWLSEVLDDLKQRLRFSNEDLAALNFALQHQATLAGAVSLPWSQLQPLLIDSRIEVALPLIGARTSAGELPADALRHLRHCLHLPPEQLDPQPLVDGTLLQSLGLKPGPHFKQLIQSVRDRQLDGLLHTQEEAIAWLQSSSKPSF